MFKKISIFLLIMMISNFVIPFCEAENYSDYDVAIYNIVMEPENPKINEEVSISFMYQNVGDEINIDVFNSSVKRNIDFGDDFEETNLQPLINRKYPDVDNPWKEKEIFTEKYVGYFKEDGDKEISIDLDLSDVINEINLENNSLIKTFNVNNEIFNSEKPDLTIKDIKISPVLPSVNEEVTIVIEVKNIGDIEINGTSGILNNYRGFPNFQQTELIIPDIDSLNSSDIYEIKYKGYFNERGKKSLYFVVDNANELEESNEKNNSFTKILYIKEKNANIDSSEEEIYESVKCIFKNSDKDHECYFSEENDKFKCSDKNSCKMDVSGDKNEKLTWKSSCGGYEYTVLDGKDETIYFDCSDEKNNQIIEIEETANNLHNDKLDNILKELKELRDVVKEQNNKIKYLENLKDDVQVLSETVETAINNFITYGVDENTKKLGEGERAAVIHSYKSAFDKLPETEEELADAIKIANGRWPSLTNDEAEKKAKEQFQKIYKRIPDMNDANDNAAVTVMAYGLRQKAENRNLESEKKGIETFKSIYGYNPSTTEDWNIMQAITYSGAGRGVDTDGDLLTDEREAELGTDPNNKDSDGDGYLDGMEVANGYDPLKK